MKAVRYHAGILLGLIITLGCTQKEMDINLTLVEDGDLEVRFTDNGTEGIAGIPVRLESGYTSVVAEATTDEDGNAVFRDILSGTYILKADNIRVDSLQYDVEQIVQVIAGETKSYTIIPQEYSGSAFISVIDYYDSAPVQGATVAVFNTEDYEHTMDFSSVLGIVKASGTTDEGGHVRFERLPFQDYGTIVYTDEQTSLLDQYAFVIRLRGEEEKVIIEF
jgi:hypothetical protein